MAITAVISQSELARVAGLCYENRPVRVSLANLGSEGFTADSTVADWDSIKLVGNGYADYRANIAVGSYSFADSRYEMPTLLAEYTADGGSIAYNSIYIVPGEYGAAVSVTDATVATNVATITTGAAHGYSLDDVIYITGMTDTDYNGFHTITGTPTADTLTFALSTPDKTFAVETGTTQSVSEELNPHSVLTEFPSISLAAGQTQQYRVRLITDD